MCSPAPIRGRGIGEHERAQRAAGEGERNGGRILDRKVARGIRGERLHCDDLAAQRAQVAGFVNQVEQDGAATWIPAPRVRTVVIALVLGLVEEHGAHHRDDLAQHAARDDLDRPGQDRAVAAMVPDEHRHVHGFHCVGQPDAGLQRVRDRFLHQCRHLRRYALQCLVDVHRVRRRQDHAVRTVLGEQFGERGVVGDTQHPCTIGGRRCRIDDRRQRAFRVVQDLFDVPPADLAGAGDCDANPG